MIVSKSDRMKEDKVLEMYDGENITMVPQNNEEKANGQPAQKITHLEEEVSQRVKLLEENE